MFKDGAVIKRVYTEEELRLQTENQKKYYYSRPEKNAVLANTAYFGDYH